MGLAASQARLLTITARLADNELRSQTINNAKMRLATQSAQASDEYVTALNNAQLMFINNDTDGISRKQALTYNSLTAYSQYNNQYGLVNSAGLLLVNENEANLYDASNGDLNKFLELHGLKWGTTYFGANEAEIATSTQLSENLAAIYGTDQDSRTGLYGLGILFEGMTNKDLYDLYVEGLSDDASIERVNYDNITRAYYNEVINLKDTVLPIVTQQMFGGSEDTTAEKEAAYVASLGKAGDENTPNSVIYYLLNGPMTGSYDYSLNTLRSKGMISDSKADELETWVKSLYDPPAYIYSSQDFNTGCMDTTVALSTVQKRDAIKYTALNTNNYSPTLFGSQQYDSDSNVYYDGECILTGGSASYDYPVFEGSVNDDVYWTNKEITPDYKNSSIMDNGYQITVAGLTIAIKEPEVKTIKLTWDTDNYVYEAVDTSGNVIKKVTQETEPTSLPVGADHWENRGHETKSEFVKYFTGNYLTYVKQSSSSGYTDGEYGDLSSVIGNINDTDTKTVNGYIKDQGTDFFQVEENIRYLVEEILKSQLTPGGNDPDAGLVDCLYRYMDTNNDGKRDTILRIPMSGKQQVIENGNAVPEKSFYYDFALLYFQTVLQDSNSVPIGEFVKTNTDNDGNATYTDLERYAAAKRNFQLYDQNPVNGTTRGEGDLTKEMEDHPNYLINFVEMLQGMGLSANTLLNATGSSPDVYKYGSEAFKTVLKTYLVDIMTDALGTPKYAWIDESDPSAVENADSRAQWYSNLFNRMQRGYKVLENGLANSREWIEYAFEAGIVTMEQVDKSYNWVSLDYKTCANIYEDSDNSDAVAKAEAKYNRAMNDIKQKDSIYDMQLKNIDTEHQSLQTEYDVVKGVMNKNIERTMKFDQSA